MKSRWSTFKPREVALQRFDRIVDYYLQDSYQYYPLRAGLAKALLEGYIKEEQLTPENREPLAILFNSACLRGEATIENPLWAFKNNLFSLDKFVALYEVSKDRVGGDIARHRRIMSSIVNGEVLDTIYRGQLTLDHIIDQIAYIHDSHHLFAICRNEAAPEGYTPYSNEPQGSPVLK